MLESSLCDYSDAYNINILKELYQSHQKQEQIQIIATKKQYLNNCAPFTDYISEINNTQADNAKEIDVVMSMYNLIEYGDIYSKTLGRL